MQKLAFIIIGSIVFLGCSDRSKDPKMVIEKSIAAYEQNLLMDAKLAFTFRGKRYTSTRTKDQFIYTRSWQENDTTIISDILINSVDFTRVVNGDTVFVPDSLAVKYSSSVNSVLYFMQLPYLLTDPAVIASYEGLEVIDEEPYDVIKITFASANGGEDFQDEYRFWFHEKSSLLDYLAYNYHTDGGGVRFRKNANYYVVIGKVKFQDYINYEVPLGTPLAEIPKLYQRGEIRELSRIINEDVKVTQLP